MKNYAEYLPKDKYKNKSTVTTRSMSKFLRQDSGSDSTFIFGN